jgi:hypothetical protein
VTLYDYTFSQLLNEMRVRTENFSVGLALVLIVRLEMGGAIGGGYRYGHDKRFGCNSCAGRFGSDRY